MEEINLIDLFNYYLKKLSIIILVTIIMMLIGVIYVGSIKTPMYHGTTTIILVQDNSEQVNSSLAQTELNLNEKLVTTYSHIIKSRRVLDQVIDEIGLDVTVEELANKISVSSVSETAIIKITVSDESNKLAAKISNRIADVFKEEIVKIYNMKNVSVIDKAATKGVYHKNNAARKVSRLAKLVNKIK